MGGGGQSKSQSVEPPKHQQLLTHAPLLAASCAFSRRRLGSASADTSSHASYAPGLTNDCE